MADAGRGEFDEKLNHGTILPKGTKVFNQVAGHDFSHGSIGILKATTGHILKPVNNITKGIRETGFYENLYNQTAPPNFELRSLVPKYGGTVVLKVNDADVTFIRLEDVTADFIKPCVMDVKVGAQTWEPSAPKSKQVAEDAKYVESKRNFGFCIAGFYVFNLASNKFHKYGKDYGRQLDKNTLPAALKIFLNAEAGLNKNLVEAFIRKLESIERWFDKQKTYAFYSSSILLVYDANKLTPSCDIDGSTVKAVMIDFAHVVEGTNTSDLNYIRGLKSLIKLFKSFMEQEP